MEDNELLVQGLVKLFDRWAEEGTGIEVISLSTADGFPIHNYSRNKKSFDPDTMAAAASTLCSVSSAITQQILSKEFKSTFIEADEGNVCFVLFSMNNNDFVLAMSADKSINIASLRISISRLSETIKDIDY